MMISCPGCYRTEGQVKAGTNRAGSQRYKCKACRRQYTPLPRQRGYPEAVRRHALHL
jgi:transposase-like protein